MISSISQIADFVKNTKLKVAVETEGSVRKGNCMVFDHPDEITEVIDSCFNDNMGLNINLAHMYLASKYNGFSFDDAINQIKEFCLALEISHHNDEDDLHKPLTPNSGVLASLKNLGRLPVPHILEFRNSNINEIKASIELLEVTHGV